MVWCGFCSHCTFRKWTRICQQTHVCAKIVQSLDKKLWGRGKVEGEKKGGGERWLNHGRPAARCTRCADIDLFHSVANVSFGATPASRATVVLRCPSPYCSGQEVESETWYTVLELVSPFNTTPELSHTAYRLYYTVTKPAPSRSLSPGSPTPCHS